jgi:hypothetical protein
MPAQTACIDVPAGVPDPTPFPTPAPTPVPTLGAELVLTGQVVGEELGIVAAGCAAHGEYCVQLQWACTRLGVSTSHTVEWRVKGSSAVVGSFTNEGTGADSHTVVKTLRSLTSYDFSVSAVDPYTGTTFSSNTFTITTTQTPSTITESNNALAKAQFSDTAGAIVVTFAQATDRGGYGSNRFQCKNIFDTVSSKRLGGEDEAAYCQWSSTISLTVELFSESTIEPSQELQLLPNAVATLGASTDGITMQYLGGKKAVESPATPVTPGPLVTGPATVGLCTTLVLDASQTTGSGGRKMKAMVWEVACAGCADATKLASLKDKLVELQNEPFIAIDRDLLEQGREFSFTIAATNFLSASATSAAVVVSKATVALPEVSVMGGTALSVFRSEEVRVRAAVVLPAPCTPGETRDSAAMIFEWKFKAMQEGSGVSSDTYLTTLTSNVETANAANKDKRVFTIPAGTLAKQDEIRYELTVTAASKESPDAKNSATVIITIKSSDLIAAIEGGSLRTVGIDDQIIVSAVRSTDPDDAFDRGAGALDFEWSCTNVKTSGPCVDAVSKNVIALPKAHTITLNSQDGSWLEFNSSYELSALVCSKGEVCSSATRSASASTVVKVGAGSPPEVGISYCGLEGSALVCGKPVPAKVNPSEKLVLEASVVTKDGADDGLGMAVISTRWSELDGQLSATPSFFSTPLVGAVGTAQLGMALKGGVLVAQGRYTFRFEAINVRTGAIGLAQVRVVANAPPSSGTVIAAACPVNSTGMCSGGKLGYAAETDFEISSLYWVDDADDLPLAYSYGFFVSNAAGAGDSTRSPLGHQSRSNRFKSQFPLGNITVIGTVYDRLGASAEGQDMVMVTIKPGVKASALVEEAAGSLDGMLEQADGEQVTRTVNMLANLLNSEDGSTDRGDAAAAEMKRKQRSSLLNSTVSAQALMEVSPRAIEQQSGTVSMLTANPSELDADGQRTALELSASLVQGSQQVGLAPGMGAAHAVGMTISSVIQAGMLNGAGTASSSSRRRLTAAEKESVAATSGAVRGMLQNLSAVMLAPAMAGEAAVEVHAPTLSLSATRTKAATLQSAEPTAFAMAGKPSGVDEGAPQPSFVLPGNFSLDGAPPDIDASLIAYRSSPYAFDATGSQGAGVLSASLKSGTTVLEVKDLGAPIELNLATADPAYWRAIYLESKCDDTCATSSDGTCDDGGSSSNSSSSSSSGRRLDDCAVETTEKVPASCAWGTDCTDCGRRASSTSPFALDEDGVPGSANRSEASLEPTCTYWHEEKDEWSTEGCAFKEFRDDYNTTVCECTHLTDFSSTFAKASTVFGVLKDIDMCLIMQNLDIVFSLVGLWLFYIVCMIFASCAHQRALRRSWYDPSKFVKENMTLGFITALHDKPDLEPPTPKHKRFRFPTEILKKRKHELQVVEEDAHARDHGHSSHEHKKLGMLSYSQHGFSFKHEMAEEHPWFSICCSADIYFFNRTDRLTILFCLLLGDMFIDALMYDGGGKSGADLGINLDAEAWSPGAIGKDFSLGIVVDMLMLPVSIGILYAFSSVVSIRERDMLYTHLPFDARIFWLHSSREMEIELYRRKLERGDDMDLWDRLFDDIDDEDLEAAPPVDGGHTGVVVRKSTVEDEGQKQSADDKKKSTRMASKRKSTKKGWAPKSKFNAKASDASRLDSHIETLKAMVLERKQIEKGFMNPLKKIADNAAFRKKVKDMITRMHHHRHEMSPDEVVKRLRKYPVTKLLYIKFVKPDEKHHPQIHANVQFYVYVAYFTAFLWNCTCTLYVFLYGICGSVEEKAEADGGGYECSGNGQESGLVRKWIGSFVTFAMVAMFFMAPIKIFFNKVILPNLVLNAMEKEGLHVEGDMVLESETDVASAEMEAQDPEVALAPSILDGKLATIPKLAKLGRPGSFTGKNSWSSANPTKRSSRKAAGRAAGQLANQAPTRTVV